MKRLAMVQHTGPNSPVGRAHGEHRRWRRRLSTAAAPFLLALLALAQALACGPRPADGFRGNSSERPYVIMVSFDGFRHDYLDRFELPNFRRVAQAGTRADALIPVFPAKTFPNHYSIATGLYPERHGLVGNEFYDPGLGATYRMRDRSAVQDGRWYGGEPIWVTAEKQGVVSAAYFWVGTEAPIQGVRPTYYRLYNARVPNEARVDTALAWLRLPPERRPHLLLLYFSNVDQAGHDYGPDSPELRQAVLAADRVLGRLLDGIRALPMAEQVHLVLVSDHGMTEVDPARTIALDTLADLEGVRVLGNGPYAVLWFEHGSGGDEGVAEGRRDLIVDALRHRLAAARIWRREEIPARLHYGGSARAGNVLVLADEHWLVGTTRDPPSRDPGTHGYDPALPSMQGIFLAMGPAVRPGFRVPAFENVHIYPLVAHLLRLTPARGLDGRLEVLQPILK